MRRRLHHSLKGHLKSENTFKLVGCRAPELKIYLEKQFTPNMTWDNYGTYWHVDHIVQIQEFDMSIPDEQEKAFHYSNLRPLEAGKNMSKLHNQKRKPV